MRHGRMGLLARRPCLARSKCFMYNLAAVSVNLSRKRNASDVPVTIYRSLPVVLCSDFTSRFPDLARYPVPVVPAQCP